MIRLVAALAESFMNSQIFNELTYYTLLITTPENISIADVQRQIASGKWTYDVETAAEVRGKLEEISSTEIISDGPQQRTFECVVMLNLSFKFWEPLDPDHYSRSDTLDTFSASVDLPAGWEIIETSRG